MANSRGGALRDRDQLTLIDVQPQFPAFEIDALADHGEIFTRPWVVELVLDLVGYTSGRALHERTLVEPSCGSGAFLGLIAKRLSDSCRVRDADLGVAVDAIRAYDLLERNVERARARVTDILLAEGWPRATVRRLVSIWVQSADFLLSHHTAGSADFVVGNPPYIRLEDVPDGRNAAYRAAWPTMTGRSDIYVGFIEKGLDLLKPDARLGFICADRWMRNQYGAALRGLVCAKYSVEAVISMHDVDAFDEAVSAYPAVTVIANRSQRSALVVDTNGSFDATAATTVVQFAGKALPRSSQTTSYRAARLPHWFSGRESWPHGSPDRLAVLEYLNDNFPPLQDPATKTKVSIGVATGADGIYVVSAKVDVEPDRLLPLSIVKDIASGTFTWSGHYLVNPWDEDGLVDLTKYPLLNAYLEANHEALRGRNVAMRRPATWFRTIDRVDTRLTTRPKLLLQDMRRTIHPVLDEGAAYPHHNLYYVVSEKWDMRVLGGLLLSRIANAFIEAYGVKMRGGTLRFQAQYLRRIRVPRLADITTADMETLAAAFDARDEVAATTVALKLYGLKEFASSRSSTTRRTSTGT